MDYQNIFNSVFGRWVYLNLFIHPFKLAATGGNVFQELLSRIEVGCSLQFRHKFYLML